MPSAAKTSQGPRSSMSLCEKSTEIAVNIIKSSSLWIAKMTLRPVERGQKRSTARPESRPQQQPAFISEGSRKKRLVEPESSPVPSYLMVPDEGEGVDRRAADYITKFRKQNRPDSRGRLLRSEVSNCIPPPPQLNWSTYDR